ncbi:gamma-glutamylcyclotransferase family protein [Azospirillum sp. ST 5-10]|uniref:gamma-glutamylcyclotransferase family protein n=1 Tax=unclassified Azospirillum TaxID=2630922 RepID=UPI003F4A59DB
MRPYFAYGSNMCRRRMDGRCRDHRPVGPAVLEGFDLVINHRGVATLVARAGGAVEGVLWLVGPDDEASLDRAEGVGLAGRYARHTLPVRRPDGTTLDALVYIDANGTPGPRCRDGYAAFLLDGAREFGLSGAYRRRLQALLGGAAAAPDGK